MKVEVFLFFKIFFALRCSVHDPSINRLLLMDLDYFNLVLISTFIEFITLYLIILIFFINKICVHVSISLFNLILCRNLQALTRAYMSPAVCSLDS